MVNFGDNCGVVWQTYGLWITRDPRISVWPFTGILKPLQRTGTTGESLVHFQANELLRPQLETKWSAPLPLCQSLAYR